MKSFKKFEISKGSLKTIKGGRRDSNPHNIDEDACKKAGGIIMSIGGIDHCVV